MESRQILQQISTEDALALESVLQNFYWGKELAKEQTIRNLEEGLVEIVVRGNYAGNGLLLTQNGYAIVPAHCVKDQEHPLTDYQIKTKDGRLSEVEMTFTNQKDDATIIKAKLNGKPEARLYKLDEGGEGYKAVMLLKRKDGKFERNYGFPVQNDAVNQRLMFINHKSVKGDSGSIVVLPDGALAGFVLISIASGAVTHAITAVASLETVSQYLSAVTRKSK